MYDLKQLQAHSEPVKEYLENAKEKTPRFQENLEKYRLEPEVVQKLKCHAGNAYIYAFSAEWCPDCYRNIPVLARMEKKAGIETRIFGHLMRDAKNNDKRWRIPPSPQEVEEFNVIKIPTMVVIDKKGEKLGEIIENPPEGKTLERAILEILES